MQKWPHSCREGMLVAPESGDGGISFDSSARKVACMEEDGLPGRACKCNTFLRPGATAVCRPWQQKRRRATMQMQYESENGWIFTDQWIWYLLWSHYQFFYHVFSLLLLSLIPTNQITKIVEPCKEHLFFAAQYSCQVKRRQSLHIWAEKNEISIQERELKRAPGFLKQKRGHWIEL
jgi:hypothetical protein